jgi:hypothetical protein
MISRRLGVWLLLVITVAVVAAVFVAPRTPQPEAYHQFADQRGWLGVPRFGNVASNFPFAVIGIAGLIFLARQSSSKQFIDPQEKYPYVLVFLGLLLTAFGSAYYHLVPGNARLVWDRLPMTVVFMSLVAALIAERISLRVGLWLMPILIALGAGSVLQWYWSEQQGRGDLRFYAAVQVYAVAVLLTALLLPARYTRSSDLSVVAGFYVLAKVLESTDRWIFSLGQVVSGHTLKHLAAAAAGYWILRMLQKRLAVRAEAAPGRRSKSRPTY